MVILLSVLSIIIMGERTESAEGTQQISMTIVYDNYMFKQGTQSDWGFSCFIEGTEKTILFDTGYQGHILLQNIDHLEIDLDSLDLIVISHNHLDHTGGIDSVLGRQSDVSVYFGSSFPRSFSHNIMNHGANPVQVDDPVDICKNVFSTGELDGPVIEQSLILDTEKGLVIITGCSHPGIVNILKKVKEIIDKNIYLVFGGFHLLNHSDAEINQIIQEFKTLGVEKCGATHCTGDRAIALFQEAYGEDYIPMGVGQIIQVSANPVKVIEPGNGHSNFPNQIKLEHNYPNPFNPKTVFCYQIPINSQVKLTIHDLTGKNVCSLVDNYQSRGKYTIEWNGQGLSSGVYFYRLQTGHFTDTKKLIIQK